ncbi:hypothetical protein PPL_09516 [Heterostelium album PN500]|uniref:Uncharacterized protein n=1 Tax=Heterostelium pallidum (strain ATCC 26659 / Pp 5 / PN500) TaxID=670386 RepID=D3BNA5_HETP5|nr:hypothetical protein PPL_09516 [Heterostelium album PN500]EFA76765.1 hypothetical protein PPL_09516 [Heterostelium album PN500]|eukprot:XP_020428897.1 hypothetical protein PPL_09516 [Heterostelium album PN500]
MGESVPEPKRFHQKPGTGRSYVPPNPEPKTAFNFANYAFRP